jgi:hypothetical protein
VGILLIVTVLTLPVVAGERSWPWWLVLVSGALAFLGFFKANYGRIAIVDGRGGIPRVIAPALAANATARRLLPFGVALMLGACAPEPTPNPDAIIVPGPGKDVAAFQQDDVICRSHAATGTGYGDLSQKPTVSAPAPGSAGTTPTPGPLAPMGAPAAVPLAGTAAPQATGAAAPALPSTGVAMANNPAASSPEPPEVTGSNAVGYLQCMAARGDRVQFQPLSADVGGWYGYPPYFYDYPYGFYGAGFIGVFRVGGFHHGHFHRAFFNHGGFHMAGLHGGGFHGGGHGGGSHGGGGHR